MRADLPAATAVAVAALLLAPALASAQSGYANAPFGDAPVALAQATALERIAAFAEAIGVAPPASEPADGDGDEQAAGDDDDEGGPFADFALVRASLAMKAPALGQKLEAGIDAMGEGGDDSAEAARDVVALADETRRQLLAPDVTGTAPFRAGLVASLLLDEGGVAESYEEAVDGEPLAYPMGYFALQRVKALWSGLSADLRPAQADDIGEMLAMLDALFPAATQPGSLSADPEQAEAPAQQLVGLLEAATNADLYPGRDIAGAAERVHDIASSGCDALGAGQPAVGIETLTIAAAYYTATVADTLGVMAPDAADAVSNQFDAVAEGEPDAAAGACAPLLDALASGQKALAP